MAAVDGVRNIYDDMPAEAAGEAVSTLLRTGALRLERIVSTGQATPMGEWYDQDEDEWVLVLRGSAGLRLAGEDAVRVMRAGDYFCIPAHARHRVEWTDADEPTVWLALHYR